MSLAQQVAVNLEHYNSWTSVSTHELPSATFVKGIAPGSEELEWVVPRSITQDANITVAEINSWFSLIESDSSTRPARVTIAIVNDDGTIVYYHIHDGVVQPRQN